jgi:hypothetical protein
LAGIIVYNNKGSTNLTNHLVKISVFLWDDSEKKSGDSRALRTRPSEVANHSQPPLSTDLDIAVKIFL